MAMWTPRPIMHTVLAQQTLYQSEYLTQTSRLKRPNKMWEQILSSASTYNQMANTQSKLSFRIWYDIYLNMEGCPNIDFLLIPWQSIFICPPPRNYDYKSFQTNPVPKSAYKPWHLSMEMLNQVSFKDYHEYGDACIFFKAHIFLAYANSEAGISHAFRDVRLNTTTK